MKINIVIAFLICLHIGADAQSDIWTAFYNEDSTLTGYKDAKGNVMITPKFAFFTPASKFDKIIAVTEEINDKYVSYYLLKSGKKIATDSLYFWDNTPDCESEGFVRFRNTETQEVGMFNAKGEVIIPATYNELLNVRNGMIVALKGAEKEYWAKDDHDGCNHFSWKGGTFVLLDTLNNVLIEDFEYSNSLNLFSAQIENEASADTIRTNFKSVKGNYYSFVDYNKEFNQWLQMELLGKSNQDKSSAFLSESILDGSGSEWISYSKKDFIEKKSASFRVALKKILKAETDYFVSIDMLNPFLYEGEAFEKYFDHCGQAKEWQYPVMNIVISEGKDEDVSQSHFEFLRTDQGYKLISVSLAR